MSYSSVVLVCYSFVLAVGVSAITRLINQERIRGGKYRFIGLETRKELVEKLGSLKFSPEVVFCGRI